ncbi:S41 family peptidase [Luteimonas terrae]|uniref:Tail specific protease domain-containing protein n=1 Tax=Luteimonas terrae TaxID=1530191 RepID=A0ABU1XXT6_9GAMM|nr:S41 family peptidase [Luteimonas terrae]MDR7193584.1 hypothetical protein [Luteimonas terrae]
MTLAADTAGPEGFAGAITSVDATAFRGQDVELSGSLDVTQGAGAATLWLRVEGPDGRLAFRSTDGRPVTQDGDAQRRTLRLHVPAAATILKLGITLQPAGAVRADAVTLKALPAPADTVSAYTLLESAIATIRAHALNASRVDWTAQQRALTPSLQAAPARDAHDAIHALLQALRDRHSALLSAHDDAEYRADAIATQPVASRVVDGVGYLRLPGLRGADRAAGRAFSESVCQAIAVHASEASAGWIVDLRDNGGGRMWPMLAGLRPLLGDVEIGAFRDRTGQSSPWTPDKIDACGAHLAGRRVAVLIGPATASSGEAVAVAFKGRPDTRFFGQPTAGLSTANQRFPLPGGSVLMLTTAVFVDRAGTVYPAGVIPDVRVDAEADAVAVASVWLKSIPPAGAVP